MKVYQLIKLLQAQNRDLPVCIYDGGTIPREITKVEYSDHSMPKVYVTDPLTTKKLVMLLP